MCAAQPSSVPEEYLPPTADYLCGQRDHDQPAIAHAILQAVAYSDIFDYPLTVEEIHRYLVGVPATLAQVRAILAGGALIPESLSRVNEYYTLPGRESIVETRVRRQLLTERLWPRALRYGQIIASLPFVRMVAITGEMAVDNAEVGSDIDFFIVTEPGRLWLCRALTVALVRSARLRGDTVCPNYILSLRALELTERNLYTARELTQMIPLSGFAIYQQMRALNAWSDDYLPNARDMPRALSAKRRGRLLRSLAETALMTPIGGRLERWEMERKIRKFSQNGANPGEVAFSADWCKGHFDQHGERTLQEFADRWGTVERLVP